MNLLLILLGFLGIGYNEFIKSYYWEGIDLYYFIMLIIAILAVSVNIHLPLSTLLSLIIGGIEMRKLKIFSKNIDQLFNLALVDMVVFDKT